MEDIESIRQRLAPLLGKENLENLDDYVTFFTKATNESEFMQAMRRSNIRYQGSFNQMVGSKFERLYAIDERTRIKAKETLRVFGIPEEVLNNYLSREAHIETVPALNVGILKAHIPKDRVDLFKTKSHQLMLDSIREYLGLK